MKSFELRETIDAHLALAVAYKKIMLNIENRELLFCWEEEQTAKPATWLYVKNTIRILFQCIFGNTWKNFNPQMGYMFKPYVRYFLRAHIRRQYQKLYSAYLEELVSQRKNSSLKKEDVDELREIASDMKDYSETLPSLKSFTALSIAVLSIMGTVFGIFDVKVSIYAAFTQEALLAKVVLIIFLIAQMAFPFALSPFIAAFHFKRFLFKDNNPKDLGYLSSMREKYDEYHTNELYNSSIYKKEDDLFESLGRKKQKPKEVPIDIIFRISIAAIFGASFIYILLGVTPFPIIPILASLSISLGFLVLLWVVFPILDYKTRVAYRLM